MSTQERNAADAPTSHRPMSWAALIGVLLAFMFIPAIVDVVVLHSPSSGEYPDQNSVNVLVVGKLVSVVIVVLAISLARWWPIVLREELRVRAWVWLIPIAFLVVSVALTDYARLATAGLAVSLTLLLGTLLIAGGEELLFRGMVLTFARDRLGEITAAVATSVVFGLSHVVSGPVNVVVSAVFGYLLYYVRRVSGGIVVPVLVHALYDFSVFSSLTTADPDAAGDASPALVLLTFALLVVIVVGHRRAEPAWARERVAASSP